MPNNAKLFTANTVSMYTQNLAIDGITTVIRYIHHFANEIEYPIDCITIVKFLTLVCIF